jgi:hypothetical protein
MLGLPGSAHTGLEGVFTHAKNSLSISILYTEAYGGELGQSTVEAGTFPDGSAWKLTVDDMTYGYGIGNVSRMAFGGAPGIILELKNKDELPRAKAVLDKALDGAKERILPARATPAGRTKIPAGLSAIAAEHDPQMTPRQLQELWNTFETANSNIFFQLAGKDLVDLVASFKTMLENGTLDRSRQKVILFSQENSRKPGFYPVLNALRELEKVKVRSKGKETDKPVLMFAVYGEDAETIRIVAENPNIAVADDYNGIMEILHKQGVRNRDIIEIPVMNGGAKTGSGRQIRQLIAGDVFTLTAAMALKALFETEDEQQRQNVRTAFGVFFERLARAKVISGESAQKKDEVVNKVIDAKAAFDLPAIVAIEKAKRLELETDIKKATESMTAIGV